MSFCMAEDLHAHAQLRAEQIGDPVHVLRRGRFEALRCASDIAELKHAQIMVRQQRHTAEC